MGALGELEERGLVSVSWEDRLAGRATLTLSDGLRRDARQLFGGP
jgi:hypothetical protein